MIAGFLAPNLSRVWISGHSWRSRTITGSKCGDGDFSMRVPTRHAQRGVSSLTNWLGFQAALGDWALWLGGRGRAEESQRRWQFAGWIVVSLIGVAIGWRFAPRYFLQLLPALVIPASRGIVLLRGKPPLPAYLLLGSALAVPLVRFGPRYVDTGAGGSSRNRSWMAGCRDGSGKQRGRAIAFQHGQAGRHDLYLGIPAQPDRVHAAACRLARMGFATA